MNEEFENMTSEQMPKIFPQTAAGQSMRWSKFKNDDPRRIFDVMSQRVFPAIKSMKYGRLPDFRPIYEQRDVPYSYTTAPSEDHYRLGRLYEHDIAELDMQGDLYEYMLGKLATAGRNGQFRIPKHIRKMMVELLHSTPDDTICENYLTYLIQRNAA